MYKPCICGFVWGALLLLVVSCGFWVVLVLCYCKIGIASIRELIVFIVNFMLFLYGLFTYGIFLLQKMGKEFVILDFVKKKKNCMEEYCYLKPINSTIEYNAYWYTTL